MEIRMKIIFCECLNSLKISLLIFVFIFPFSAKATVKSDFEAGVKLFELERYAEAAIKFEKARRQGLKSTPLYYNIASTYFKLENYNKSELYFKKLVKLPKIKSLANYNLAIISLKKGDKLKATRYLTSVVKDNEDSKLVYLSKNKLSDIKPDRKSWSLYASVTVGFDDNINIAPDGIVANESDYFSDYVVSADYVVIGNRKNGWIGDIAIVDTNYLANHIYDQRQYGIGIKRTKKINGWDTYTKINFNKFTYSHDDYQSIIKLEAQGRYNWSKKQKIYLKYRYEDISSDNVIYNYIDGWRQRLKAEYRRYHKDGTTRVYYELELNDRKDFVPLIGNAISYSPTRHAIRIKHTRDIDDLWRATGDVVYRSSDYPATANQDRSDNRTQLMGYVDYRLGKYMSLRTKLEYIDNTSNEASYDYVRTVLTIGVNAFF